MVRRYQRTRTSSIKCLLVHWGHMKTIPEAEIAIAFARGSGPGGQNVNKTETKVEVRWHVGASASVTDDEKMLLRTKLGNRLTVGDELVVTASEERSQEQNRTRAVKRLQDIVRRALTPEKRRIPTKPTRASRRRRLEVKARTSRIKKLRKEVDDE